MGWVRFTGKSLEYTGKIKKADSYEKWAIGEGKEVIGTYRRDMKCHFISGKMRYAKKMLWDDLRQITNTQILKAAINEEVKNYTLIPGIISEKGTGLMKSDTFPNVTVVPLYMIHQYAFDGIVSRLDASDEINRLKGGDLLKQFFFRELTRQLDMILLSIKIDTHRPVASFGNAYIVATERSYRWSDTLLPGLCFVTGNISGRFSNDEVKSLENAINVLMIRLGRLSHDEKERLINDMQI